MITTSPVRAASHTSVASQSSADVSAVSLDIEQMIAEGRLDRQFLLLGKHWESVRHLWLGTPEPLKVARLGDDLPRDFWFGAGMPGLADIRPTRDGRFKFAKGGLTTVIVPVYDTIPGNLDVNPAAHVEHLVDLVAVDLGRPDQCWRRRGEALVLGNAFLEIAGQGGAPVPIFRNPLTWLRSGGAGVCILDFGWARELLLDRELIAEDVELGTRLEAALAPSIMVMEAA